MSKKLIFLATLSFVIGFMYVGNLTADIQSPPPQPVVYSYSGAVATYMVPGGVNSIRVVMWGAGGGGGEAIGGGGGYSTGIIAVTPGEILDVIVGGGGAGRSYNAPGGWPNGGNGGSTRSGYYGSGGGGRSSIARGDADLIVAGGGGGAGAHTYPAFYGGAGGGLNGLNAPPSYWFSVSGMGGTQTVGGSGGGLGSESGGYHYGGTGDSWNGTGGGDGYYGGGAGDDHQGGGGGSGYIDGFGVSDAITIAGLAGTGTPGGISDPSYISGIGIGGSYNVGTGKGGDGLVVIAPEAVADTDPPITSDLATTFNPVAINTAVTLTAVVDDSTTGNSSIASAEYCLDSGPWTAMTASDTAFKEVIEEVTTTFLSPSTAGIYDLCVRSTDIVGNEGTPVSIMLVVYDPSGGFVTGGGWIDSPEGAYRSDPLLMGKANFGFVSKYKKGATNPTGQTEFVFQAGDLNFHSSSYEWLVVNQAGSNAQFKGSGTINDEGNYKFMLWAGDDDPDTFRIKIWYEDGAEVVVYDNGFDQDIGGGSIVVHKK